MKILTALGLLFVCEVFSQSSDIPMTDLFVKPFAFQMENPAVIDLPVEIVEFTSHNDINEKKRKPASELYYSEKASTTSSSSYSYETENDIPDDIDLRIAKTSYTIVTDKAGKDKPQDEVVDFKPLTSFRPNFQSVVKGLERKSYSSKSKEMLKPASLLVPASRITNVSQGSPSSPETTTNRPTSVPTKTVKKSTTNHLPIRKMSPPAPAASKVNDHRENLLDAKGSYYKKPTMVYTKPVSVKKPQYQQNSYNVQNPVYRVTHSYYSRRPAVYTVPHVIRYQRPVIKFHQVVYKVPQMKFDPNTYF